MDKLMIELKQAPVIEYNAIDQIASEVENRLKPLNLNDLVVSEDNLTEIKRLRTDLNKEFKVFESSRMYIKEMVEDPYKQFLEKYKKISSQYKQADSLLKAKVSEIEDLLLEQLKQKYVEYFEVNKKYEWLEFKDVGIKETKTELSKEKQVKEQIDSYIAKILKDVETINTMENKNKILIKFMQSKDFAQSLKLVADDMERERALKVQIDKVIKDEPVSFQEVKKLIISEDDSEKSEPLFKLKFEVTATKKELLELKQFLQERRMYFATIK